MCNPERCDLEALRVVWSLTHAGATDCILLCLKVLRTSGTFGWPLVRAVLHPFAVCVHDTLQNFVGLWSMCCDFGRFRVGADETGWFVERKCFDAYSGVLGRLVADEAGFADEFLVYKAKVMSLRAA